eukprot:TRINITY_DN17730_c0_g1_i1.p1 TRINITY_DN17730_c0_g1~~TRINITY_DN17730_c0_g1_i1.p1  ORF type:complete len:347 (-),score=125.29 TRINITY_DN17730_c0_g1_i1:70-1110(-)
MQQDGMGSVIKGEAPAAAAAAAATAGATVATAAAAAVLPCRGPNYKFYKNRAKMQPIHKTIEQVLTEWDDDFETLEWEHTFIQWFFPMFEGNGVNWHAHALDKGEARHMRRDMEVAQRVVRVYRLMLHFYGMELLDERTGEVGRHPTEKVRVEQYRNLNFSGHNNLRITRIITSLGQLGFVAYRRPFVEFLKKEVEHGDLKHCSGSLRDFWMRLLDPSTTWYTKKTCESPEDREPSVFFQQFDVPHSLPAGDDNHVGEHSGGDHHSSAGDISTDSTDSTDHSDNEKDDYKEKADKKKDDDKKKHDDKKKDGDEVKDGEKEKDGDDKMADADADDMADADTEGSASV